MTLGARFTTIGFALLLACSSKEGSTGGGPGGADVSASSSGGPAGGTGSSDGGGTVVECSDADLAKCDYPARKLKVTEREGISIHDATTGRDLPLLARIPEGVGPLPVVIWSHGGSLNATGHKLGAEWGSAIAGQGYVVVHPAHVPLTMETGKAICDVASIPAAECNSEAAGDEESALVATVKAIDIVAVLDNLKKLSDESVARGGPALDLARVAAAGWSGGSRGPVVLLGAKVKTTPSAPLFSKPDERIVAAVGISTAGPGFGGFYDDGGGQTSWTTMRGPLLICTGQNDIKPTNTELTGPIRRFPFTAQPGDGTRRLLYSNLPVGVGSHGTYNLDDDKSSDERLSRLSRALRSAVLAFLDEHVRGDATAKAWLATDNAKILAGEADWEHR